VVIKTDKDNLISAVSLLLQCPFLSNLHTGIWASVPTLPNVLPAKSGRKTWRFL